MDIYPIHFRRIKDQSQKIWTSPKSSLNLREEIKGISPSLQQMTMKSTTLAVREQAKSLTKCRLHWNRCRKLFASFYIMTNIKCRLFCVATVVAALWLLVKLPVFIQIPSTAMFPKMHVITLYDAAITWRWHPCMLLFYINSSIQQEVRGYVVHDLG